MASSMHPTESEARRASAHLSAIAQLLLRVGLKTGATFKSALKTMQTARLMSILAGMSDSQLAEIGISRSDIPQYAERLLSSDLKV